MRVLVTGGLGFIGSHFIQHLLSRDHDISITNVDSMSIGSNRKNAEYLLANTRYRFVRGSIADSKVVWPLIDESDVVVNLAAETHVDRSISSGKPFVDSNILGVFTILEGIRKTKSNVALVQVGTDEEYGEIIEGSFTEESPLTPSSPYAATKASASLLVLAYVRTYGLDAKVTRCTNNYGPRQFPEKLIPKSIIRAHLGLDIPVYGDGKSIRDWINVKDHCEALDAVMQLGNAGRVYNIAGGREIQDLEVLRMILGIMKKPESLIQHVEDRPGHDRRYSLNDKKARNDLGWKPKKSLEDGLEETVGWYLKNEQWWRPIIDAKTLSPMPWKEMGKTPKATDSDEASERRMSFSQDDQEVDAKLKRLGYI